MSKCTIIIPTFNRPRYLKRILSYYDNYARDFNIIVADSSSNENKMINRKIISSLSNIDIQYLEKYSGRINLLSKLYSSLSYIKTKYSVFCADDDFITPNGINQSIDFLESNKDFTCAHGYYISFCLEADKKEEQQFYWKPIYPYNSIICTDAKARLLFLFSSYYQTFYAVHRTDFSKMVFKENCEFADDERFGELLTSMLDLIYGKMKKLDVLYNMREKIIDSLGATIRDFKGFMKDGTYEKKYNKFRTCLVKHLIKNFPISIDEAKELIDDAMSVYLKKHYFYSFGSILSHKISIFLDNLYLPESVKKSIRILYRRMFAPKYILNNLKEINDFQNKVESPNSKYFNDFEKIRNHVLLYEKKTIIKI